MIKIVHLISDLDVGGAEMMLFRLVAAMNRGAFQTTIVTLRGDGPLRSNIESLRIPVRTLGVTRKLDAVLSLLPLTQLLRRWRAHIVQTWMYHSDLLGGIAARGAGSIPVVWGIRQSSFRPQDLQRTTLWTLKACARLSRALPARIICCSEAARRTHVALGYAAEKMVVIPNGFDLSAFRPDPFARASVREEFGVPPQTRLVGVIARFHPQKDHQTFLRAAARLATRRPDIHFLLCGDGIGWDNPALTSLVDIPTLRGRLHLLGPRRDVPRLMAALDVVTSSSAYGEAFPNVIGEALACGVPCVVTDVGDSAEVVGDAGRVVPPRDPVALARAWDEMLALSEEERRRLGLLGRARVEAQFSLPRVTAQYEQLYHGIAERAGAA